jgi:hypothetical protein
MEKKMFLKSSSIDDKKTLATASVRINNPKQGLFRNLINETKKTRKSVQSATISGSKAPLNLASSELQLNYINNSNFLNSSTTFNSGSTICVNSTKQTVNSGTNSKSTFFSNTKRKRGSLFNLFSFQKPSLSSKNDQKNTKINDENNELAVTLLNKKNLLPPPPPEFADTTERYQSELNKFDKKLKSSNENSLKNSHKSIFSALKRKSVKSVSLENDYKQELQETDSMDNSISSDSPTLLIIKDLENKKNNSDISDAESTISNLFSFDNYITESCIEMSEKNVKEELKYANEYEFQEETTHLADIGCDMIIIQEKLKKTSRNKEQVKKIFTFCMLELGP